ncbi:MAG: IS110 family transposase [Cypionkella sp.]
MEACGGAHHVGRFCLQFGHEPRLMSPLYVRPYVKVHKNDDRDAEGIAEAATRPTMSFVPIKSEEQLDLQALHRAREQLVQDRTRLINQARGFLMERGIRPAQGRHVFQKFLTRLAEDHKDDLTPRMMALLADMAAELGAINEKVAALDSEIKSVAGADQNMRRLMEIPGVGPTIATALVAAVGNGNTFGKGRDLAAWLGLVPRHTTGGKAKLIGISKHGNTYLRKLFIHGVHRSCGGDQKNGASLTARPISQRRYQRAAGCRDLDQMIKNSSTPKPARLAPTLANTSPAAPPAPSAS